MREVSLNKEYLIKVTKCKMDFSDEELFKVSEVENTAE